MFGLVCEVHITKSSFIFVIVTCILIALGAVVKYSQTGQVSTVKLKFLSMSNNELLSKDKLIKGTDLFFDYKGQSFPVEFICLQGLVNFYYMW